MDRKEALKQFIECKEMGYLNLFMPDIPAMEKAIEALQEKDHRCDNCSNGENAEGKNVFEIIEEQPQVGGWIPVLERLPKDCGEDWVLVQIRERDCGFLWIPRVGEERSGKWWLIGDEEPLEDMFEVIAWQPLPEPYKGGKD